MQKKESKNKTFINLKERKQQHMMLQVKIMKNLFIEYPKCSTCKKAKKWLQENGIEFDDRHIIENNPSKEELKEWIKKSGKEIKKWFNTSGLKYKELNLKDKIATMTEEEKIEILSSDGMLVKRPIFISDKGILIGFKEDEWTEMLKQKMKLS